MQADIHTLYQSDFYQILDFKCRCTDCRTSKPEYSQSFSISFVRKGNFLFNAYRNSFDSYTGCVLISKPWYERTVTHTHTIPDECTIFDFTNVFYDEIKETYGSLNFLFNNDIHSFLVKTDPEAEVLHRVALSQVFAKNIQKLKMDSIIVEIIENIFGKVGNFKNQSQLPVSLKKHHLTTIEIAKEYLLQNYQNDISLLELARHCNISPFHFSRLFKQITTYAPYQFLTTIRLKHAAMLLKDTALPVTETAFFSGFNSLENFSAAFRKKYRHSPEKYRNENKGIERISFKNSKNS